MTTHQMRTPWRYIIHHSDGPVTRLRKRVGRFAWHRGWITPTRVDVEQGLVSSGNLSEGERQGMFRNGGTVLRRSHFASVHTVVTRRHDRRPMRLLAELVSICAGALGK